MARVEISPSWEKTTRRAVQEVRAIASQLSINPTGTMPGYEALTSARVDEDGATHTRRRFILGLDELGDPNAVLG